MPRNYYGPTQQNIGATDATLRFAMTQRLQRTTDIVMHEMSLPAERTRADLAVPCSSRLNGYEIKSRVDTLSRLPRQMSAYEQIFARCYVVVDQVHLESALSLAPIWWGVVTTTKDGQNLRSVRRALPNENLQPAALVQLLWRQEAMTELSRLGEAPSASTTRADLWAMLLEMLTLSQLQRLVTSALSKRDPAQARIPTRWSRV